MSNKDNVFIAVNEEVSSIIQQYIIREIKRVLDKYKSIATEEISSVEKLINSILLTHFHFSVAKHFFINSVTLLHSVDYLALHTLVGSRESGDSLINIGIKVGAS